MSSATRAGAGMPQPAPGHLPPAAARVNLWMKFPERNIYSTCWRRCFRRSDGFSGKKKFLYPQASPQAVHKLCPVVHRLSTGVPACWLCGWTGGGYRSGVPVFHGRTKACNPQSKASPGPLAGRSVEKLWIVGITSGRWRHPGPRVPHCQSRRVVLDAWRVPFRIRKQDGSPGSWPGTHGGRQL